MSDLKLPDACRRLNAEYGGDVTYQRFYLAIAAGRIPATRKLGGAAWLIAEEDLPTIAEALGFRPSVPPAPNMDP
jgi:hypothetical protein